MAFLNHVANQSNLICSQKNKKTVFPDHVIDALKVSYPFSYWLLMAFRPWACKTTWPKLPYQKALQNRWRHFWSKPTKPRRTRSQSGWVRLKPSEDPLAGTSQEAIRMTSRVAWLKMSCTKCSNVCFPAPLSRSRCRTTSCSSNRCSSSSTTPNLTWRWWTSSNKPTREWTQTQSRRLELRSRKLTSWKMRGRRPSDLNLKRQKNRKLKSTLFDNAQY